MIEHNYKFIFVHIPRTGGSSIETAFRFGMDRLNGSYTFSAFPEKHIPPATYKAKYFASWRNYFKFTIVRNPWDRAVSLYEWVKMCVNHPRHTKLSFHNWMRSIRFDSNATRPQAYWLDSDINFIGRFENLESDFQHICEQIDVDVTLPHINRIEHNHYRNYYTIETRDWIAELYKDDIRLFEYEF